VGEQEPRAASSHSETHLLAPKPPVRAYAIAAVGAVVGAALIVAGSASELMPLLAAGVVVLLLAVVLAVLALVVVLRVSTRVIMDDTGLEIRRVGRQQRIPWSEISTVKATRHHFIVVAKSGGAEFVNPRDDEDRAVVAFMTAIRDRLDADRGYGRGDAPTG